MMRKNLLFVHTKTREFEDVSFLGLASKRKELELECTLKVEKWHTKNYGDLEGLCMKFFTIRVRDLCTNMNPRQRRREIRYAK